MAGLEVAASVIAVVNLSAKVAKLCIQYSLEAKDAKSDILRLHNEVKNLGKVVSDVQHLVAGPGGAELSASEKLLDAVTDCSTQLKTVEKSIDPGKIRKAMGRFGARALRWPFQSKQVDKIIQELERCKGTISLALQVDQTYVSYIP
jgi:Fungal N-terminal domain of STAND proteins